MLAHNNWNKYSYTLFNLGCKILRGYFATKQKTKQKTTYLTRIKKQNQTKK